MSTLEESVLRYSVLSCRDDHDDDERRCEKKGLHTTCSIELVDDVEQRVGNTSSSTELNSKESSTVTIGLQVSDVDIQHKLQEVQSEASLPSHECPFQKTSSPFEADRKVSLNDYAASSSRKTSATFGGDRKISLIDSSVGSVTCRICLEGDAIGDPLINPCLCTGSASHVHITCLKKWLMTSGNSVCELCLYELDVGWKATSMWKALKNLSHARMTNRKICWALLVSIAALTLPLFCICIFVLDDENLRLQLSQPASMALSYGVILISCTAYLALLFMVAYLTWKWSFCPNTARCHFPTEIEIRVESLEERLKRGRTRRGGYHRNATPILNHTDLAIDYYGLDDRRGRTNDIMDSYWMTGGGYV